jgi:RNA polymerase sigma-70 factor (ECF subfamily)
VIGLAREASIPDHTLRRIESLRRRREGDFAFGAVLGRLRQRGPAVISERGTSSVQAPTVDADDARLLTSLRAGDEGAFRTLVSRHHGPLKRFAVTCGASDAVAEEVVQETWIAALEGFDRFEGRSSLRGWLFGIVKNQARKRSARERRMVPMSSLAPEGTEGPLVDPARFQGEEGCWPHHWAAPPRPWEDPERRLASLEARGILREAIASLPPRHRVVVALRDVEGLGAEEVCDLLEISAENQRVLLHRGRSALRKKLEEYVDE